MKKVLWVLLGLGFATLMLPGIMQQPAESTTVSRAEMKTLAHAVHLALLEYREEYGRFPEGEAGQIMDELRGKNEKKTVFFVCPREALNDKGELLDPWGTAVRIGFDPEKKNPKIQSAGPNRHFEGKHTIHSDDLVD